jgi:hypothetical protein
MTAIDEYDIAKAIRTLRRELLVAADGLSEADVEGFRRATYLFAQLTAHRTDALSHWLWQRYALGELTPSCASTSQSAHVTLAEARQAARRLLTDVQVVIVGSVPDVAASLQWADLDYEVMAP